MQKSLIKIMVGALGIHVALMSSAAVAEPQMPARASMGQVTSVSQLSDVRPTDWAYQALVSLVEKKNTAVLPAIPMAAFGATGR